MLRTIDSRAPWEASELEIQKRPPSTLRTIEDGPLGGGARDPGVPTINAKKSQRLAPWKVPELEIRE
jgi:hypothetical protein